jgi:iron complex outermembrane recepter protein
VLQAAGGTAYANFYNQFLASHPGQLPASALGGLGLNAGGGQGIQYWSNSYATFDQSNAEQKQYSVDLEFKSHLEGPFNFMLGGFYLRQEAWGDYYVSSGAQGYGSVAIGALEGLSNPACYVSGCTFASAFYDNNAPSPDGVTLKSESAYGQVYYDIIPNLLKLTAGARWTQDYKSSTDSIYLFNEVMPVGDNNKQDLANLVGCAPNICRQDTTFDKITGNASIDYTPTLPFTDQTLIYASYGRGYKAGGFNPGLSTFAIGTGVPTTYQPEGIDAFEAGTKNTLLNSTLQANLDFWYYNYEGLQVSQILDNDSINVNVNSRMYGSEGKLIYAPDDHWLFDLNVGYVHSQLGNQSFVDPRNPTASAANAVLIKDDTPTATAAQNCAVYLLPGNSTAPGDNPFLNAALAANGLPTYADPPGGSGVLAHTSGAQGIPYTNYGSCSPAFETGAEPLLEAFGYTFGYSNLPGATPLQQSWNKNELSGGVLQSVKGDENPNTPPWTIGFGAQYTFNVGNDYTLVPRVDFYYQTQMWGRIFEDPADRINSYTVTNAQIQFNSPDNWYVQAFIKNAFNATYVTGEYLTSSSSGLYTNEFLGDPRMYGVRVGFKF